MSVYELTDIENACLEAAQESKVGLVSADDVVGYVEVLLMRNETATIARPVSKAQVSRTLRKLHDHGILHRQPRGSLGWGQGWEASYYSIRSA